MMTAIILAGGKSTRLGRSKAHETIGNESLLCHVIHILTPLTSEIIVVTAQGQGDLRIPSQPDVRSTVDLYQGRGPLAGIHSGLIQASSSSSFVVACDMPFLNQRLLHYMMGLAPDFDIVIPRVDGRLEPLHAVYSKACLPQIEKLLEEGTLSLNALILQTMVKYVGEEEIDRFDPDHLSFFNLNTQTDLDRARVLVGEKTD